MPVMDDIRKETSKMKDKTFKEKLAYFWGYYKFHTLAAIALLIMVICLIHDVAAQKENAFYALLVNAGGYPMADDAGNEFAESVGIDLKQYDIKIDTSVVYDPEDFSKDSYYGAMKLSALLAAGEVDTFVSRENVFTNYALNESFFQLDEVMTAEQIAVYEGDIYYIDQADIDAKETEEIPISETAEDPAYASCAYTEDHRDPSQMENPIAAGIYLNVEDIPFFMDHNCFLSGKVVYGFMRNGAHTDQAVNFLSYLTGK